MVEKYCKDCDTTKPASDFHKNAKLHLGLFNVCKSCAAVINKRYRDNNKEHLKKKRKERQSNPMSATIDFESHLKRKYNISLIDYNLLLEKQNGVCAICKNTCSVFPRLSVDHCHITGKVRGLLCNYCNVAIGSFREDPEIIKSAMQYVQSHA